MVVRSGDLSASSNTGFQVGGQTAPARSAASGVIDERVLDGVRASGGHLDIVYSGSSIRVNWIQILRPVAAPQGVTASVQANPATASVALRWAAVDGARGYRVYRSTEGKDAAGITGKPSGPSPYNAVLINRYGRTQSKQVKVLVQ